MQFLIGIILTSIFTFLNAETSSITALSTQVFDFENENLDFTSFESLKKETDSLQEKAKIGLDLLDLDPTISSPRHRQFGFREKSFVNFRKKYLTYATIPIEESLRSDITSLLFDIKTSKPKYPMYITPHRFMFSGFDSHLMKETIITLITEKKWILKGFDLIDIMKGELSDFEQSVKNLMKAGVDTEIPVFIVLTDFHEYISHPELFDKVLQIVEKATSYSKMISDEFQLDMNVVFITNKPYLFDSDFLKTYIQQTFFFNFPSMSHMKLMMAHSLIDYEITPKEVFKSSFNEFDEVNTPISFLQASERLYSPLSFLEIGEDSAWSNPSEEFQILRKSNVMFMVKRRKGNDVFFTDLKADDEVVAMRSSKIDLNFTALDSTFSQLVIPSKYTILYPSPGDIYRYTLVSDIIMVYQWMHTQGKHSDKLIDLTKDDQNGNLMIYLAEVKDKIDSFKLQRESIENEILTLIASELINHGNTSYALLSDTQTYLSNPTEFASFNEPSYLVSLQSNYTFISTELQQLELIQMTTTNNKTIEKLTKLVNKGYMNYDIGKVENKSIDETNNFQKQNNSASMEGNSSNSSLNSENSTNSTIEIKELPDYNRLLNITQLLLSKSNETVNISKTDMDLLLKRFEENYVISQRDKIKGGLAKLDGILTELKNSTASMKDKESLKLLSDNIVNLKKIFSSLTTKSESETSKSIEGALKQSLLDIIQLQSDEADKIMKGKEKEAKEQKLDNSKKISKADSQQKGKKEIPHPNFYAFSKNFTLSKPINKTTIRMSKKENKTILTSSAISKKSNKTLELIHKKEPIYNATSLPQKLNATKPNPKPNSNKTKSIHINESIVHHNITNHLISNLSHQNVTKS